MPQTTTKPPEQPRANEREEGAVLIVVLMLLLSISATAVYAVSTATSELRGARAMRTAYQAESVALSLVEGALMMADELGADGFPNHLRNLGTMNGSSTLDLSRFESVPLAPGNESGMFALSKIASPSVGEDPQRLVADANSLNRSTPSVASGVVIVYDGHGSSMATPGARSDGGRGGTYYRATFTGHAVIELADFRGVESDLATNHRTFASVRAVATIGPSL